MSKKYYQQKQQLLGGYALTTTSNTAVSSSISWGVPVTSNTSIVRIYSENYSSLLKYNSSANTSSWDYVIPANSVLDLYNYPSVTSVNVIGDGGSPKVRIAQY